MATQREIEFKDKVLDIEAVLQDLEEYLHRDRQGQALARKARKHCRGAISMSEALGGT